MAAKPQEIQNSLKSGRWLRSTCKMCLHSCGTIMHITDDGIVNKIEGSLGTHRANGGKPRLDGENSPDLPTPAPEVG